MISLNRDLRIAQPWLPRTLFAIIAETDGNFQSNNIYPKAGLDK